MGFGLFGNFPVKGEQRFQKSMCGAAFLKPRFEVVKTQISDSQFVCVKHLYRLLRFGNEIIR